MRFFAAAVVFATLVPTECVGSTICHIPQELPAVSGEPACPSTDHLTGQAEIDAEECQEELAQYRAKDFMGKHYEEIRRCHGEISTPAPAPMPVDTTSLRERVLFNKVLTGVHTLPQEWQALPR